MRQLMVGRDLSAFYHHTPREPEETILKVTGLRTPAHPEFELDFDVHAGEIVGLAGLVTGANNSDFIDGLFSAETTIDAVSSGFIGISNHPGLQASPVS